MNRFRLKDLAKVWPIEHMRKSQSSPPAPGKTYRMSPRERFPFLRACSSPAENEGPWEMCFLASGTWRYFLQTVYKLAMSRWNGSRSHWVRSYIYTRYTRIPLPYVREVYHPVSYIADNGIEHTVQLSEAG